MKIIGFIGYTLYFSLEGPRDILTAELSEESFNLVKDCGCIQEFTNYGGIQKYAFSELKKDFSCVYVDQIVNPNVFKVIPFIHRIMENQGLNSKKHYIHSAEAIWELEQVKILFKYNHYLQPMHDSDPYYKIMFKEA
jgi:hypothetical protein